MTSSAVITEKTIVEPIPLRDQVADIVRRMILSGELKGDDQISERTISQMLNVSTTPIKEAFRALETEGLLYVRPRRGSYVSKLSRDFMLQLVFMRGSLEGTAAYFAAMNVTDDELQEMEDVLAQASPLVHSSENAQQVSACNSLFHSILRNASRNSYLINLITSMRSIDKTFREVSLTAENKEPARAHKEHLDILAAMKTRDSAMAEQRMVSHVRRVALLVLGKK